MIPEGTRDAEPVFCILEVMTQVVPLHGEHPRTSLMLRCGSPERPSPIEHPSRDKLATWCGHGKPGLCNRCEADLELSRQRPAGCAVVQVVVGEVVADVAEQGAAEGATTRPVREAQPEKRPKLHRTGDKHVSTQDGHRLCPDDKSLRSTSCRVLPKLVGGRSGRRHQTCPVRRAYLAVAREGVPPRWRMTCSTLAGTS